ncbi:uncharacterized protein [Coffea arabica]|uniref:Uncharacterized protein n=1 Tax=Coffea arabica TaxID=13443 RepID=A0A6P6V908_COFAR
MDVEIHLESKGLGKTIVQNNDATSQDHAKAMIFLRHHLDESLKTEYLTVKNPLDLWISLKERFDHLKLVVLPKTRYDWLHLRLQDFKSVPEYNSAMFRITSQLKLCGENVTDEDMLEKTFSTFHVSNVVLQQQYRAQGFKKYSELITCLLLAEQNNELLWKNRESQPTDTSPFPEVNVTQSSNSRHSRGRGHGRSRGRGRGRGRGHDRYIPYHNNNNHDMRQNIPQKRDNNNNNKKYKEKKNYEEKCYRYGMGGHWSRTCRTADHLVELYQASLKGKNKGIETNFIDQGTSTIDQENECNDDVDMTSLDMADFIVYPEDTK